MTGTGESEEWSRHSFQAHQPAAVWMTVHVGLAFPSTPVTRLTQSSNDLRLSTITRPLWLFAITDCCDTDLISLRFLFCTWDFHVRATQKELSQSFVRRVCIFHTQAQREGPRERNHTSYSTWETFPLHLNKQGSICVTATQTSEFRFSFLILD